VSLLSAHDMVGIYTWLHTTDGAGFIAAVITVVTFLYSLYVTWRKHGKLFAVGLMAKQPEPASEAELTIKG
jgi:hypothetical protein